jgi:hypothetical protein
MNQPGNKSAASDLQARLDRLADGELSRDEYQALLAALDDEPGGWKRCAFAFLEAQALTGELNSVRRSLDAGDERVTNGSLAPRRRWKWNEGLSMLAIAASFLCVFSLGIVAPRLFSTLKQDRQLAGNLPVQPMGTENGEATRHEVLRPVGNLRLVMDGPTGEASQSGQVPVYEVGQDIERFLSSGQPALGPELIDYLRRHGYDVQHEQQYFPAPLDDGRQIIVPVDGYQITPVGRRY